MLSRPQEKFFTRVQEIEKQAKQLEKNIEEKANVHDINGYFEELPVYL